VHGRYSRCRHGRQVPLQSRGFRAFKLLTPVTITFLDSANTSHPPSIPRTLHSQIFTSSAHIVHTALTPSDLEGTGNDHPIDEDAKSGRQESDGESVG